MQVKNFIDVGVYFVAIGFAVIHRHFAVVYGFCLTLKLARRKSKKVTRQWLCASKGSSRLVLLCKFTLYSECR